MKRVKQSVAGLLMVLGLTAVLPSVADEVVATAAGGWFAVDSRAVKDTTLAGGVIIGGATNVVLQSSPDAWGETGGGTSATINYVSAAGSGTVAAATTAREVEWTPAAHSGTNTLTYLSGAVEKTAQFFALTPVAVTIPSVTHTTVTNITVNGESVAVATPVTVPEHATVVVFYKADTGYHLSGETTATLADITDEHKTIDVSAVTVAEGELCSTWAQVKAALESGYSVKLTQDMDAAFGIGYPSGYDLTIDMNGKTVTRTVSDRLFGYGNAKIRVTDSVGGGCFTAGTSTLPYRGSFALLINKATFVLDGDVTIEGFKAGGSSTEGTGGAFAVDSGASLIISNGVIRGCSANTNGGAVYLKSGASFTMAGGEIVDCTAASLGGALYSNGAVVLTNGVMALNHANGGAAICFEGANGTVSITDMTFTNNVVSGYGGAINFGNSGGSYVMRNCLVKGNSATATGGAISVGTGAQVDIYDCTMTDNKSTNGGAVHLNTGANNRIRIYGIVLAGNTKGAAISDFNLEKSGAVTAYGGVYGTNPSGVSNLTIADGYSSTKVGSYWVIGRNVLGGCGKIVNGTLTFCPTNAEYVAAGVAPDSTKVTISGSGTSYAVAPKDGVIEANAWAEVKSALEAGKSVKLMANVTQSAVGSQVTLTTAGLNVFLDLNGYAVTCYSSNCRFVEVNVTSGAGATFTLKDSVGTGVVKDGSWMNGGCVWLAPGNFFVMEGGRIYNCSGNSTGNSGAVYVNGATFTMNGGTIDSCKNLNTGSGGGAVCVMTNGTFIMNGGMITNCTAAGNGGGVLIKSGGTFTMNGGTIAGCMATTVNVSIGGGVCNEGTFDMIGGIITNCSAAVNAGGIHLSAGGTLNLKGGVIANCSALWGGGVRAYGGTFNLSGTKIVGCRTQANGNGMVLDNGCVFTMTGGEVVGCRDVDGELTTGWNFGGAVLFWTKVTANIYGGAISNNTTSGYGGAITVGSTCKGVNIYGGIFSNNVCRADGKELLYRYGDSTTTATVWGGVFDKNPTTTTAATTVKDVVKAGGWYVVGTSVAQVEGELTAGTYTFCPTNAEYVAAGVVVADGFEVFGQATTPKTWLLTDHIHCICGDGACTAAGHVHEVVGWQSWTSTTTLPTSAGNYYLANNVTLSSTYQPVNGVNLCLNGKVVKQTAADSVIIVNDNVNLTLTDCQKTEHKYVVNDIGLWEWNDDASGGTAYESLTARPAQNDIIIVKGGAITGGRAYWYGGGIYYKKGNVTLHHVNVIGNRTTNKNGRSGGGGLYNSAATTLVTLTLNGAKIVGNYSHEWGGGIHNEEINGYQPDDLRRIYMINDTEISFNRALSSGGALYAYGHVDAKDSLCRYNLSGFRGNLCLEGVTSFIDTEIIGNTLDHATPDTDPSWFTGEVAGIWNSTVSLALGGATVVKDNLNYNGNQSNLKIGTLVTVSTSTPLTTGAKIGVTTETVPTMELSVAVTSNRGADSIYFVSDNPTYGAVNLDGVVKLVTGTKVGDAAYVYVANNICTVFGTGAATNGAPIDSQWNSLREVHIADGVTGVGTNFFYMFTRLTNVTVAASCTSLGNEAFFRCLSIEKVAFEGTTLPTLGTNALPIRAAIKMEGDTPVVTMVPKVTVGGKEPALQGSNDLQSWENVTSGNEKNYHFFKFVVQ